MLPGGTVIPLSAVVPTVLEKSMFYGYLTVPSISLELRQSVRTLLPVCNQSDHYAVNIGFCINGSRFSVGIDQTSITAFIGQKVDSNTQVG